jgi:hypothetical protein
MYYVVRSMGTRMLTGSGKQLIRLDTYLGTVGGQSPFIIGGANGDGDKW